MIRLIRENVYWALAGSGTGLVVGAWLASPRGIALGDAWYGPILLAGSCLSVLGAALTRASRRREAGTKGTDSGL
jgi:hypothetical protein